MIDFTTKSLSEENYRITCTVETQEDIPGYRYQYSVTYCPELTEHIVHVGTGQSNIGGNIVEKDLRYLLKRAINKVEAVNEEST